MDASVFVATSLDGYIARPDGSIDWLPAFEEGGEDYGYREFIGSVDALVMGRRTFEAALGFDDWPYRGTPVVVLSRGTPRIPDELAGAVEHLSGAPGELVARLAARGVQHVYVDGGATIQGFLAAGLITRLTITTIPLLLGAGIPLFGPLARDVRLRHVETRAYRNGLVQNRYEVIG